MALPVNIEDLLCKRKVESERIEFKEGWNPDSIYRSICAFANDIDNIGGGYILIGVEEKNGMAQRPIKGLPPEQIDSIQRKILSLNKFIKPAYTPRLSVEEIDGNNIIVIWVPSGTDRPYTVPERITAKEKKEKFFVRYGSSSIEAKDELLDQLREMSAKVPFDERGNDEIKYEDISMALLRDYLVKVKSKLAQNVLTTPVEETLSSMGLITGSREHRQIKNVAAMMFCEHLYEIFPYSQIEIVIFPEGREKNPKNLFEPPVIKGTVPQMIKEALTYLRTVIIQESIVKVPDRMEAERHFNYPYAALEEAITNAMYHRDYTIHEPVEITVEPDRISILSFSGPDRSISDEAIKNATSLRSRRYRNRRLGDFLKEAGMTEGRATGIPTIQQALEANGSPKATITTDEYRTFFLIDIPCHKIFAGQPLRINKNSDDKVENILEDMYNDIKQHPNDTLAQIVERYKEKDIQRRRFG